MTFSLELISGLKLGIEYIDIGDELYVVIDVAFVRMVLYL